MPTGTDVNTVLWTGDDEIAVNELSDEMDLPPPAALLEVFLATLALVIWVAIIQVGSSVARGAILDVVFFVFCCVLIILELSDDAWRVNKSRRAQTLTENKNNLII